MEKNKRDSLVNDSGGALCTVDFGVFSPLKMLSKLLAKDCQDFCNSVFTI